MNPLHGDQLTHRPSFSISLPSLSLSSLPPALYFSFSIPLHLSPSDPHCLYLSLPFSLSFTLPLCSSLSLSLSLPLLSLCMKSLNYSAALGFWLETDNPHAIYTSFQSSSSWVTSILSAHPDSPSQALKPSTASRLSLSLPGPQAQHSLTEENTAIPWMTRLTKQTLKTSLKQAP